jgi:hypothetical protein
MNKWHYVGDVDIMNGGYFWREDGQEDYVLCVRVTACADAGGPENMAWVETGSIYLFNPNGSERRRALDYIGWPEDEAPTRAAIVNAMLGYQGLDKDEGATVRIGKPDPFYNGREEIEPDTVLRAGANLKNWIKRQGWLA